MPDETDIKNKKTPRVIRDISGKDIDFKKLTEINTVHLQTLDLTESDTEITCLKGHLMVHQNLFIRGCPNLTMIQNIQVGGQIIIEDCPSLTHIGLIIKNESCEDTQTEQADITIRRCPHLTRIKGVTVNGNTSIEDCPRLSRISAFHAGQDVSVSRTGIRDINQNWLIAGDLIVENNPNLSAVRQPSVGQIAAFGNVPNLRHVSGEFPDVLFLEKCPSLESLTGSAGSINGLTGNEISRLNHQYDISKQRTLFTTDDDSWSMILEQKEYSLSRKKSFPSFAKSVDTGFLQWVQTIGHILHIGPHRLSHKKTHTPQKEIVHSR